MWLVTLVTIGAVLLMYLSTFIGVSRSSVGDTIVGIIVAYVFYFVYAYVGPAIDHKSPSIKLIAIVIFTAIALVGLMFAIVLDSTAVSVILGVGIPNAVLSEIFGGLVGTWIVYLITEVPKAIAPHQAS